MLNGFGKSESSHLTRNLVKIAQNPRQNLKNEMFCQEKFMEKLRKMKKSHERSTIWVRVSKCGHTLDRMVLLKTNGKSLVDTTLNFRLSVHIPRGTHLYCLLGITKVQFSNSSIL